MTTGPQPVIDLLVARDAREIEHPGGTLLAQASC